MATPSQNLRPLSTAQRFNLLAQYITELMPQYGYSGRVADFIIAQAALETGNFTSDLLLRADNAFGMRIAHQRPQPRIGESNGYAVYDTLRDSVADYLHRQRAFGIPNTNDRATYIQATVNSGYAEAQRYAEAWTGILDRIAATDYATALNLSDDAPPTMTAGIGDGGLLIGLLLLLALAR